MPNRTTPEFWKDDLTLNSLTRDAELLFRKIQHICDDTRRFPITPTPQAPKNLWSSLYYLRDGVRCTDVARWLDEIQKAGAILVRNSERGWYGTIDERLWYRAEDYAKGAPRHGPRLEKASEQPLLPLGAVSVVRSVPMQRDKSKPNDSDSGNGNDTDSTRVHVMSSLASGGDESRNRVLSQEKKESSAARFARDVSEIQGTGLGRRLCQFLGMSQAMKEATESGAEWMRVIREEPDALVELLEIGERIRDAELQNGPARAKFLTKRLGDRRAAA